MKSPLRTFLGFLWFGVFFGFGFLLPRISTQFDGRVAMSPHFSSRDPAAIRSVYDFSAMAGSSLSIASKNRIMAGFETFRQGDSLGISLGHFVLRGASGEKQFACQKYQRVVLSFEGEGMAVGGEKPSMQVEGACIEGGDVNRIAPLMVPMARILGEPVADGEFEFAEKTKVKVRFSNVTDQWPTDWSLSRVRLLSDDENEPLDIGPAEIRTIMARPVVLHVREFQQ